MPIKDIARGAQGYLEKIKMAIGEDSFSQLISEGGGATLMFAIDTTGSMAQEINAAKAIATSIVNRKRQFPVDYILSPFNDPCKHRDLYLLLLILQMGTYLHIHAYKYMHTNTFIHIYKT